MLYIDLLNILKSQSHTKYFNTEEFIIAKTIQLEQVYFVSF